MTSTTVTLYRLTIRDNGGQAVSYWHKGAHLAENMSEIRRVLGRHSFRPGCAVELTGDELNGSLSVTDAQGWGTAYEWAEVQVPVEVYDSAEFEVNGDY